MKTLVTFLLAFTVAACHFQRGTVRGLEIVEFGTFQRSDSVAERVLLERTTEIHAIRGTTFGLRVRLVGDPPGITVPITVKCFHPKFTDPSTGRSSDVEQWSRSGATGSIGYVGYTFDNDWELVPGQWTIQVSVGSMVGVEKSFNVSAVPSA